MDELEKIKQYTKQELKEREDARITWEGIKFRHKERDIGVEWHKYKIWLKRKKINEPRVSVASLLAFEKMWLKSINVSAINNPSQFTKKEKEISLTDIQAVSDLLSKRGIKTTEEEVRAVLNAGVSVNSVELWFSYCIIPKNAVFKKFLKSKNWR